MAYLNKNTLLGSSVQKPQEEHFKNTEIKFKSANNIKVTLSLIYLKSLALSEGAKPLTRPICKVFN